MKVILFGGTGFIGKALLSDPSFASYRKIVVSRNPGNQKNESNTEYVGYDRSVLSELIEGSFAVINLAGANIGDRLWTDARKKLLIESRTSIGHLIAELVNEAQQKPKVIIQASAVGFYGNRGDTRLNELSEKGSGFLADVVSSWEQSLGLTDHKDVRVIFMRTGLVLSREAGMLKKLQLAMKWFTGGHFGTGRQWLPWIHWKDEVSAICFLLQKESSQGVYNLTAPFPERMSTFMSCLGGQVKRPSWLHIPAWIIRLIPGGFGEELLLNSQFVYPEKLLKEGFSFQFDKLDLALEELYRNE